MRNVRGEWRALRYLSDLAALAARPDHERVHRPLYPLLLALHTQRTVHELDVDSEQRMLLLYSSVTAC